MTVKRCTVCEELTSEAESCDGCGRPMCPACYDEYHGTCSENCYNKQQYYAQVDYEYDRMMDR